MRATILGLLLIVSGALITPAEARSQVGECWGCGTAFFGGCAYSVCEGTFSGAHNCAQQGNCEVSACSPYGGFDCETPTLLDGSVFSPGITGLSQTVVSIVAAAGDPFVRRICDGAIVARLVDDEHKAQYRAAVRKIDL